MRKSNIVTVIGLILFCVIIILPPLIHGYVYPGIGDDSAVHLNMMNLMINEGYNPVFHMYFGYSFVAYPIIWLHQWLGWSIDTIYLWFSYSMLILSGLVIYFAISRLINKFAGWLALLIVLFCSQSVLFQFYYGILFNMINMGVIFPLLIYSAVLYINENKRKYLVATLLFVFLFAVFHTSGIYLPIFISLAICVYILYNVIKHKRIEKRLVWVSLVAIALSVGSILIFIPDFFVIVKTYEDAITKALAVPLTDYLYSIVSIITIIIVLVLLPFVMDKWGSKLEPKYKTVIFLLIIPSLCLGGAIVLKLASDPFRQALDLSTILALLASVLTGIIILKFKQKWITVGILLLIGFGLYHNLPTWFGYNNAITMADQQAIEYVNTVEGECYNTSDTIAHWVYQRFINKKFTDATDVGLLITRNEPMTPRSTEGNHWYKEPTEKFIPDDSYSEVKEFVDGEVVVKVYEK